MKKRTIILAMFIIAVLIALYFCHYLSENIRKIRSNPAIAEIIERKSVSKGIHWVEFFFFDVDSNIAYLYRNMSPRYDYSINEARARFNNRHVIYQKDNPENWYVYPINDSFFYYLKMWLAAMSVLSIIIFIISIKFLHVKTPSFNLGNIFFVTYEKLRNKIGKKN